MENRLGWRRIAGLLDNEREAGSQLAMINFGAVDVPEEDSKAAMMEDVREDV